MNHQAALVWFRRDLRLTDNPALLYALQSATVVIPVYIHDPEAEAPWCSGAASQWWLHHSLKKLDESLRSIGSQLIVRRGNSLVVLRELISQTGASLITWNRLYEPTCIARDTQIKQALREQGLEVHSDNSALLFEPWIVKTKQQTPFKVFTPFWRSCQLQLQELPTPLAAPSHINTSTNQITSLPVAALELLPTIKWYRGFETRWSPGEQAALQQVNQFTTLPIGLYATRRDHPAESGTSSLSPHLHFGEIGPRQILAAVRAAELNTAANQSAEVFIKELGWREFAHHLIYHFPQTTDQPLDTRFNNFPWQQDTKLLSAWHKGRTGVPLVDAGMRELWHTGWMHNRVRMIVASFLTKNLRMHWLHGARWFWDTLVDANLANNTLGWQWTAGCGADAAPYFRVFNPVVQAERFDPDGLYIRKWIPEIAKLENRWIACPWQAPESELIRAQIKLGQDYPRPVMDLSESREQALSAYQSMRSSP